jgi:predicted amidohydrolase YtcJ
MQAGGVTTRRRRPGPSEVGSARRGGHGPGLQPGRLADLVLLGEDLLTIDAERILDAPIDMTVVGCLILHERP